MPISLIEMFVSIILTLLSYGTFPIIFAKARKTAITSKKFTFICFAVNFGIRCVGYLLIRGSYSIHPYLLWTFVFSAGGRHILKGKYLLVKNRKEICPVCKARLEPKKDGSLQCFTCGYPAQNQANADKICFCRKCGEKLIDNTQFCRKCGTEVVVVSEVNDDPLS